MPIPLRSAPPSLPALRVAQLVLAVLAAASATAHAAGQEVTLRAVRTENPVRIDGVLDEAIYERMPPFTGFIQSIPNEGSAPTELTEAWIFFDDDNIYVSGRIWDSAPESEWVANEMRRDTQQLRQNDTFGVMFDTFYDRRNAYLFYTNPLGALADAQIMAEGPPNSDWNPVWEVRTGRFEGGWTAELAIPFKSLRYRPGADQVWGVQLRRVIRRRNEWNHATFIPLSVAGNGIGGALRVSMYGTLEGVETPPESRNLEVKPYVISGLRTDRNATPTLDNDGYADAGLDLKYGITESLTVDLTVNTDFAQVEVDEQQVNLTRFTLSFPEKREFFLEGRGIFEFGGGGGFGGAGGGGGGGGGGTTPNLFYSRRIGLQGSDPVPIVAGARLTGKVGPVNVGALNVQTGEESAAGAEATNFSVLRLRGDILQRSSVGVLATHRSRSIAAPGESNQTLGADASFGFYDNLSLFGYYAVTRTPDSGGDESSYRAQFSYAGDLWGAQVGHLLVGDEFNPEVGFLRRRGLRQNTASARYSPRPASIAWIRQFTFEVSADQLENTTLGRLESRGRQASFQAEMETSDLFSLNFSDSFERLFATATISGAAVPAGTYRFQSVNTGYTFGLQRRYSGRVSAQTGTFYTGRRTSVGFTQGRVQVLPQLSLEPSIQLNWISFPVGDFDQHLAVMRASYSLSPRTYVSGLVQYNSGSDSFAMNLRLRWEWAPGSEVFLVYTEDRATNAPDVWSELSNRGLVLKVNRLLRL